MLYPGQYVQIVIKFVPASCLLRASAFISIQHKTNVLVIDIWKLLKNTVPIPLPFSLSNVVKHFKFPLSVSKLITCAESFLEMLSMTSHTIRRHRAAYTFNMFGKPAYL